MSRSRWRSASSWFLFRTRGGLIVRATGDNHSLGARARLQRDPRTRFLAVLFGGACAGLAGGYLSIVYTPQWVPNMTAGRGWIALALVVFGTWLPFRVAVGALLFGAISILQLSAQGHGDRHSAAVPGGLALPDDGGGLGRHLAQPYADARQHAGLSRTGVRARPIGRTVPATDFPARFLLAATSGCWNRENLHAANSWPPPELRPPWRWPRAAPQADPLKVCFVYVGPHNDGGYSQQHDIGRQDVAKALGDKVDASTYIENVKEEDSERPIRELAQKGCKLIFTTSFGFMDRRRSKVAKDFPNVKFEHATGFMVADNVSTYNIRWYEGRYVMGQIAAKMSKKGLAGYIVSFPIPEVIMGIDAFMLGAQSVNPDFKVKIVWVSSWFDPGKEGDAANVLINQGADIIVQHTDSPAGMQAAEKAGIHAFGQSADMSSFGPKAHMASLIDNWGPYYIARVTGGARRHLEVAAGLGGLQGGPPSGRAAHQHARRREGDGRGLDREDQVRRAAGLQGPDHQAGRHARRSPTARSSTTAICSA